MNLTQYSKWRGDSAFGQWQQDRFGAPSFLCSGSPSPSSHTTEPSIRHSPWHQTGNLRLTATAHCGGWLQMYSSDRGLCNMTPWQPPAKLFGGGVLCLNHRDGTRTIIRRGIPSRAVIHSARFGLGYTEYSSSLESLSLSVNHWSPEGNSPALVSDISWTGPAGSVASISLLFSAACWPMVVAPLCTGTRRETFGPPPAGSILSFLSRNVLSPLGMTTDKTRWRKSRLFKYENIITDTHCVIAPFIDRRHLFNPDERTSFQKNPLPFFAHASGKGTWRTHDSRLFFNPDGSFAADAVISDFVITGTYPLLEYSFDPSSAHSGVRVIWGCAETDEAAVTVESLATATLEKSVAARMSSSCRFSVPEIPWIEREWMWHGDSLRSATMYDNYTRRHITRQGSAYYFLHAIEGAPRDHAIYSIPLTYLDPDRARETIESSMCFMKPDGIMPYGVHGYGQIAGFGLHDLPSDLPLAFLWALTEYIFATRDFAFLDKHIPWYPRSDGSSRTVREQITITCDYLMHRFGTGPNGLLRVGTGDWNDPLNFHAPNRRAFIGKGESVYNTAMALYVMPRVASLVSQWDTSACGSITSWTDTLSEALARQWNGRWLYRAWDGLGHPIGDNHLHLEHNAWALVSDALPADHRRTLADNIFTLLDEPSPIGARSLHPPRRLRFNVIPQGWDTNGGVWPAINMLLTWGYSKVSPQLALSSLIMNTFCAHAEAYPDIWYGVWSGPDAFNAPPGRFPGETFSHFTPMADFPAMNANAHAAPLLASLKLAGIEPSLTGFTFAPALPEDLPFSLSTPLVSVSLRSGIYSFSFSPQTACTDTSLTFHLPHRFTRGRPFTLEHPGGITTIPAQRGTVKFSIPLSSSRTVAWKLRFH